MRLNDFWPADLSLKALVQYLLFISELFFGNNEKILASFCFHVLLDLPRSSKRQKQKLDIIKIFIICCRNYPRLHRVFFSLLLDWSSKLTLPLSANQRQK